MSREEILKEELSRIKNILIKDYGAQKIIVFGSFAQKKVNEYSDLDIVVIKDTKERFLKRIKAVVILTKPSISIDFLVYNQEEVKKMTKTGNKFFTEEIIGKGEVIYDGTSR